MQKAIIGKKVGMTQIFDESGKVQASIPNLLLANNIFGGNAGMVCGA